MLYEANSAYFPYNSDGIRQLLSVGPNTADSFLVQMGTVGIDFSGWTLTSGLEFNNGAIFWMSPNEGQVRGVAGLTIPTGTI